MKRIALSIAVPMSVREQTQGLAYMLNHSGAKLLVYDADLADLVDAGLVSVIATFRPLLTYKTRKLRR